MSISPFLFISQPCNQVLHWLHQQLTESNLRSVQTFDLHEARAASGHCACPHHGTDVCDCQMVILLVYGSANAPVTLILHGNDGQTWPSIGDNPYPLSADGLMQTIRQALDIQAVESAVHTGK